MGGDLVKSARPHPVGHPVDDVPLAWRWYSVLIASPQIAITGLLIGKPAFSSYINFRRYLNYTLVLGSNLP